MPDPSPTAPQTSQDLLGWSTFKSNLRARLVSGLILVIPLWITVVMLKFVFGLLRDASLWIIEWYLLSPEGKPLLDSWDVTPELLNERGLAALPTAISWVIGLLAVLVTVGIIYILGTITTNVVGRQAIRLFEGLLGHVPVVKTIYRGSRQVLNTFAGDAARPFQRVVSVPFPTPGIRSIAFVTGHTRDAATGEELLSIMLANPMTGFIFVVRKSEVVELDWGVEDAVKMMMSGGALVPESMPMGEKSKV